MNGNGPRQGREETLGHQRRTPGDEQNAHREAPLDIELYPTAEVG